MLHVVVWASMTGGGSLGLEAHCGSSFDAVAHNSSLFGGPHGASRFDGTCSMCDVCSCKNGGSSTVITQSSGMRSPGVR